MQQIRLFKERTKAIGMTAGRINKKRLQISKPSVELIDEKFYLVADEVFLLREGLNIVCQSVSVTSSLHVTHIVT